MKKSFSLFCLLFYFTILAQDQNTADINILNSVQNSIDNSLIIPDSDSDRQYVLMAKMNQISIYDMISGSDIKFLQSIKIRDYQYSKVCSYKAKGHTIELVLLIQNDYFLESINLVNGTVLEKKLDPEKDDQTYFEFSNAKLLTSIPLDLKTFEHSIIKSVILTEENSNVKYLLLSTRINLKIYRIDENQEVNYLHSFKINDFNTSTLRNYIIDGDRIKFIISLNRNYYHEDLNLNTGKIKESKIKFKKQQETLFRTYTRNGHFNIVSYNKSSHVITNRTINSDLSISEKKIPCNNLKLGSLDLSLTYTPQHASIVNHESYDPIYSSKKTISYLNTDHLGYLVKSKDSLRYAELDLETLNLRYFAHSTAKPKKYSKSNHYIFDHKLFSIYTNRKSILLNIKNIDNGALLKTLQFENTSQFSDLFVPHNPDIYKTAYLSNFRDEEEFIINANKNTPLITVQNYNSYYVIRIGGKEMIDNNNQSNTNNGLRFSMAERYNSNNVAVTTRREARSKYVHELWLDTSLKTVKNKPNNRAIEHLNNYFHIEQLTQAHINTKYNNTYLQGYYSPKNNTYLIYEFNDSKALTY